MDLNNYLGYLIVSVLTITSPGAAILLAINNSMKYDLRAVVFSSVGNVLGLFLLSLFAMLGVGIFIKTSDTFFWILKIIGAIYLVYLGIKHIISGHENFSLNQSNKHIRRYSPKKVFVKGFLVAATNPKPILFFTAIFPLFLSQNHPVVLQFFIMTFTFMLISFVSLMAYGLISKHAKVWFFDDKSLEWFYKISGAVFVLMGIGMLFIKR